jgi:hypothetical protein
MGVHNWYKDREISTRITGSHCMYDGGAEGSNLEVFNGAKIPPGSA